MHRESLAGTSLAIGEDAGVVTLQTGLRDGLADDTEDIVLGYGVAAYVVEVENVLDRLCVQDYGVWTLVV